MKKALLSLLMILITNCIFAQVKDTVTNQQNDTTNFKNTKRSSIQRSTSNGTLGTLLITTGSGTTEIGAQNSIYNHFMTSLPRHYFNKSVTVNGTIGSYDNQDLLLQTGTIPRLYIKNNGNVGIGRDPGVETNLMVYGSENPSIELKSSKSFLQIGLATADWCFAMGARPGDAVFRQLGSVDGHLGMIFNMPSALGDGNNYIRFGDQKDGLWFSIYNNRTIRLDGKILVKELFANTNVESDDPGSSWLAIKQDKTVRIDGTLYAKEINVKTDVWSDFVFDKTYKLKTLEEVEEFINTNKHLPDVPSETEAKENGVDVAKMNAILLQKVEELTLYIIELKKEVEQMKQLNKNN